MVHTHHDVVVQIWRRIAQSVDGKLTADECLDGLCDATADLAQVVAPSIRSAFYAWTSVGVREALCDVLEKVQGVDGLPQRLVATNEGVEIPRPPERKLLAH